MEFVKIPGEFLRRRAADASITVEDILREKEASEANPSAAEATETDGRDPGDAARSGAASEFFPAVSLAGREGRRIRSRPEGAPRKGDKNASGPVSAGDGWARKPVQGLSRGPTKPLVARAAVNGRISRLTASRLRYSERKSSAHVGARTSRIRFSN